ncbi:MAG: phospholipase C type enzyme [Candelina submexicana]|nr:MAG: phospholipase C type enzyme [Candelina submexicana]
MVIEQAGRVSSVNVLTINCWGLKYLAKDRNARLNEIGARIASSEPALNIVGLQECWTQEDYQSIRQQTKHVLPFAKYYYSGIFGGGLAILSKWRIEESSMVRYPLNGRPTAFFRGDWFVGKGVACARIRLGPDPKDVAEVFTTHLHAPYEQEPHDSYICHRTAQAWEIAKLMRGAVERGHLVIGLGDFNIVPLSLAHRLITTHGEVEDAWRLLHPNSSLGSVTNVIERTRGAPTPTVIFNLTENGATCDSALNTWRWTKEQTKRLKKGEDVEVDINSPDPWAKRLDYIFVGNGRRSQCDKDQSGWAVHDVQVGMTERHLVLKCSLSDHFSVAATLIRNASPQTNRSGYINDLKDSLPDGNAPSVTEKSSHLEFERLDLTINGEIMSHDLSPAKTRILPLTTYDEILVMIETYNLRERRQRHLRLSHFVAEVTIAIGCMIAVWWSPHNYVSFILIFVSTIGLGAGVLDGLIGGLFVGSELRALKEFEWEIRNAREAAEDGLDREIK